VQIRECVLGGILFAISAVPSFAGSILLTGHDVLLHSGQNGFDTVTLDYLRGAGTAAEVARSNYSIAVVGSGAGFWAFTEGGHVKSGFESTTYYDTDLLEAGTQSLADALSKDVLVILSHTSCGGCDLSTTGSNYINSQAGAIATRFNAGMDIWGLSGASLATYYNFLPPGAVATGAPIGGSSGFTSTAAGSALGFTNSMINGFPTHNRFPTFDADFQVFETRGDEIITIGLRDARIDDGGGIIVGPGVPEPSTYLLLSSGFVGLAFLRRRKA
jgi:hypothetical protein